MPDPYAHIASADAALQARLVTVLELRAAEPQQRAMLGAYLSEIHLSDSAIALDAGCGTGAVTRVLAELPGIRKVIGIDPSLIFIEKARELEKEIRGSRSKRETLAPCTSPTRPSTSWCFTPCSATCQNRSELSGRPIACFVQVDG